MLLKLIKEASLYGWHVVGSADVSAKVFSFFWFLVEYKNMPRLG
jgi:hypothetical protein